jgi:hypothetical protein
MGWKVQGTGLVCHSAGGTVRVIHSVWRCLLTSSLARYGTIWMVRQREGMTACSMTNGRCGLSHMVMMSWQRGSTWAWQHDSTMAWRHDSMTVRWHDSMTVWPHDSMTVQRHDIMTRRRHDGAIVCPLRQVVLHWAVRHVCLQHAVIGSGSAAWSRHQLWLRSMELTRLCLVICSGIPPILIASWSVDFSRTLRLSLVMTTITIKIITSVYWVPARYRVANLRDKLWWFREKHCSLSLKMIWWLTLGKNSEKV